MVKEGFIYVGITILLIISGIVIANLLTSTKSDTSTNTTILTTIVTETTKDTTTTKTTLKLTKKTTTKRVVTKIKVNENEITKYLYERILAYGWSTEDYNSAVNIIIKESGFNPNSVNNKSGACGLFQAYPCSIAVKQYPDYKTNYKSQIEWGLNYIKGRYKTPTKAWEFWLQHKWY